MTYKCENSGLKGSVPPKFYQSPLRKNIYIYIAKVYELCIFPFSYLFLKNNNFFIMY